MSGHTAIRVISLDTEASVERRKLFQQTAESAGVAWEFFSAFSGAVSPVTYDDEKSKLKFGRSLRLSEIGCYTSHFKLWEWLVNSNFEQAIIFEDDTLIDWTFIGKLANMDFNQAGIDILRFFSTDIPKVKNFHPSFLQGKYHLSAVKGPTWGTQGYMVTRTAAECLIARYSTIEMPIDWVLTRYWEHHMINFLLFPAPLLERDVPSMIGFREHWQDLPLFGRTGKLYRFLYRAYVRLKRAHFDFTFLSKLTAPAEIRTRLEKND